MSEIVISVEHLTKRYRLGVLSHRTLTHDLQTWWAMKRGLDDPNQRITHRKGKSGKEPDEILALDDVSFEVRRGEVLGVIGKNGAGKSTLLKILSQVTAPTTGRISVRGHVASLLEVGTGFHPELTGKENIFLNGAILGMDRLEIQRKFDEIVDFSGVDRFIDTPVKRYSSGMYVRLAFAVAAHLEPEVLVVDEVLAVGDAEFQRKCLGKMHDVAQGGRTVLFVSHNMAAVQSLCGRSLLMEDGKVRANDVTKRIVHEYLHVGDGENDGTYTLAQAERDKIETQGAITEIRLLSMSGIPKSYFFPEEGMIVELKIHPGSGLRKPRVAVAIEDEMGRRISVMASYFNATPLGDIMRPSTVSCVIPKLNLGEGTYFLSASFHTKLSDNSCEILNACRFQIVWNNNYDNGEPYYGYYGPVLYPSEWELK